jgi:hypothetical protein
MAENAGDAAIISGVLVFNGGVFLSHKHSRV